MKNQVWILILLCAVAVTSYSQDEEEDCYNYDHHTHPEDTTHEVKSIKEFFTGGRVEGHMRNYLMMTINEGDLNDYWANATGGALAYHTDIWKGLQFGVKGIFTFNTASCDLNAVDTLVGRSAKWEKELFDVNRPTVTHDLDRLEEFYIKYYYKKSFMTFGKIDINRGPLLLKRDGRMKPFVYKGFWSEFNQIKNTSFNLGWIYGVSARGMTEWHSMSEVIGLNNNGYQPDGSKADYHDKSHTLGLFVFGLQKKVKDHINFKAYNYYLHHLINVSWFQVDYEKDHLLAGLQYVHEFADPQQHHLDYKNRYYQPDEKGNVISGRIGWQSDNRKIVFSGAHLHGFETGRFIFPKELTREGFYVSQPRSWAEGYGAVDITSIRAELRFDKKGWSNWSIDNRLQSVMTGGVDDYANNKYGNASYMQFTSIINYSPKKALTGVHFTLMYVGRLSPSAEDLSAADKFYKTNIHHFNFITNIYF